MDVEKLKKDNHNCKKVGCPFLNTLESELSNAMIEATNHLQSQEDQRLLARRLQLE